MVGAGRGGYAKKKSKGGWFSFGARRRSRGTARCAAPPPMAMAMAAPPPSAPGGQERFRCITSSARQVENAIKTNLMPTTQSQPQQQQPAESGDDGGEVTDYTAL